jgi:GTP-binding protein
MAEHAKMAIHESDLILFVVDVREGLIPFDKTIADFIRTSQKPMWLLVNKFDTDNQQGDEYDFYSLGLDTENLLTISAEHGRGLILLREKLYGFAKSFQADDNDLQKGVVPNFDVVGNVSIIGAPNVGKSTLLNRLTGAQRALVSNIAGTTVDPIEAYIDLYFGDDAKYLSSVEDQFRKSNNDLIHELESFEQEFAAFEELPEELKDGSEDLDDEEEMSALETAEYDEEEHLSLDDMEENLEANEFADLEDEEEITADDFNPWRSIKLVDTAGIRKSKLVEGFIEEQSVYRSLRAIAESDVVIFMIDATKGITHQDRRLCDIALDKGKSLVLCLNKIDLIKDTMSDKVKRREYLLDLRATIPWLSFCELLPISAMEGKYISQLKNSLIKTLLIRSQKVSTGKLNKVITELLERNPVVVHQSKGARLKVKYASMLKASPPTFLLFSNKSKQIPVHYRRYLTNGIRKEFKLTNTPVHLIFRTTTEIEKRMRKEL